MQDQTWRSTQTSWCSNYYSGVAGEGRAWGWGWGMAMAGFGCSQHLVFMFNSFDPSLIPEHTFLSLITSGFSNLSCLSVFVCTCAASTAPYLKHISIPPLLPLDWVFRAIIQTYFSLSIHFKTTIFIHLVQSPLTFKLRSWTIMNSHLYHHHDNWQQEDGASFIFRGRAECLLRPSVIGAGIEFQMKPPSTKWKYAASQICPKYAQKLGCRAILPPNMPPTSPVSLCV